MVFASVETEMLQMSSKLRTTRISSQTMCLTVVFSTVAIAYFYTMVFVHASKREAYGFLWTLVVTLILQTPVQFLLIYVLRNERNSPQSILVRLITPHMHLIECYLIIVSVVSVGTMLCLRVLNGTCENLSQTHMWFCNSEGASRALPQEAVLIMMMIPILYSTIVRSQEYRYILFAWILTVLFMVAAILISDSTQSWPAVIFYVLFSGIVLYENYRQNVVLVGSIERQEQLLAENMKYAEDQQTELRHMIANVAHDLKTPLSAFMSGVEGISNQITSLTMASLYSSEKAATHNTQANNNTIIADCCDHIQETVKSLENTNSFMIMTINRCIDYTKASKGLKLEARLETVDLLDILMLPVNCLRDMQSRVSITLAALPHTICSHIITDKQWLQENIFCLLSNAVKYSSGRTDVTITTNLVNARQLPKDKQPDPNAQTFKANLPSPNASISSNTSVNHVPSCSSRDVEQQQQGHPRRASSRSPPTSISTQFRSHMSGFKSPRFGNNSKRKVYITSAKEDPPPLFHCASDVESQKSGRFLLFEIEDRGIGLSLDAMAKLFVPFKQAQRRAGGTGLGLYSLAKRVEALGGYYGVRKRNDSNQGSLFWFAIPYVQDTTMTSALTSHEPSQKDIGSGHLTCTTCSTGSLNLLLSTMAPITSTAAVVDESMFHSQKTERVSGSPLAYLKPAHPKLRVLIVDDSLTILKMTANLLRRQGHTVTQAENGADGLAAITQHVTENDTHGATYPPFDVVLMDLNMPVMDGLEATTRLRAMEKVNNVSREHRQFTVGFSANSDTVTMNEAYTAGVDDFVSKPFALQTFYDAYYKHKQQALVRPEEEEA